MIDSKEMAYPGKFLGNIYDYLFLVSGVFILEDKLCASISGEISINNSYKPPKISIMSKLTEYFPKVNDEVYFKLNKVTKYVVMGEILATKKKLLEYQLWGSLNNRLSNKTIRK
jgi:hypothetical protein